MVRLGRINEILAMVQRGHTDICPRNVSSQKHWYGGLPQGFRGGEIGRVEMKSGRKEAQRVSRTKGARVAGPVFEDKG